MLRAHHIVCRPCQHPPPPPLCLHCGGSVKACPPRRRRRGLAVGGERGWEVSVWGKGKGRGYCRYICRRRRRFPGGAHQCARRQRRRLWVCAPRLGNWHRTPLSSTGGTAMSRSSNCFGKSLMPLVVRKSLMRASGVPPIPLALSLPTLLEVIVLWGAANGGLRATPLATAPGVIRQRDQCTGI